jgi:hypothetical protein
VYTPCACGCVLASVCVCACVNFCGSNDEKSDVVSRYCDNSNNYDDMRAVGDAPCYKDNTEKYVRFKTLDKWNTKNKQYHAVCLLRDEILSNQVLLILQVTVTHQSRDDTVT